MIKDYLFVLGDGMLFDPEYRKFGGPFER